MYGTICGEDQLIDQHTFGTYPNKRQIFATPGSRPVSIRALAPCSVGLDESFGEWGDSEDDAKGKAMEQCRNGHCRVVASDWGD